MPETTSARSLVLLAKQREIDELNRLQARVQLSGILGHMVHVLQSERGASSVFLASNGARFRDTREQLMAESEVIEGLLRAHIDSMLSNRDFTNARIISLMAWTLLGLDALPALRRKITHKEIDGSESVASFTQLIAGQIALIFELADAGVDAEISRLLVGLFNLIEGKELAGQERATGALAFASGHADAIIKQRIGHLIEGQERSFRIFLEFSDEHLHKLWQQMQQTPCLARLNSLREMLLQATQTNANALDTDLSDGWFECCSQRVTAMWKIQRELVERLGVRCNELVKQAQQDLHDSAGLVKTLGDHLPARASMVEHVLVPDFTRASTHWSQTSADNPHAQPPRSIIDLLHNQSARLAGIETELASARQALQERKNIERAKGLLMSRYQLSEEAAFKRLRNAAMQQNCRLADIAGNVLKESQRRSVG